MLMFKMNLKYSQIHKLLPSTYFLNSKFLIFHLIAASLFLSLHAMNVHNVLQWLWIISISWLSIKNILCFSFLFQHLFTLGLIFLPLDSFHTSYMCRVPVWTSFMVLMKQLFVTFYGVLERLFPTTCTNNTPFIAHISDREKVYTPS
jgi:hypothetical protein